jgi:hypothetical protein
VDYWTRELINAYNNVIRNIYISEGDFVDGHLDNFLEEIESNDSVKVYASVWEVSNKSEIVYTKDGKVVLNKEPSATLLRIMGNQLNEEIFMMVQIGTSQSLAEVHKLACARVFAKTNEDRSFMSREHLGRKSRVTWRMMPHESWQIFLLCEKR